ncbi:MAG TPA: YciI family protein [Dehalococcoidia bacterium]|nr:YciI family protein [Dehalococcoidia bacterium]
MPDAQFYAYRIQPTRPAMLTEGLSPAELDSFQRHSAYLQTLVDDGIACFIGRTLNRDASGWAATVFKAESEAAARAVMNADPFVRDGVMRAELFPFRIVAIKEANAS